MALTEVTNLISVLTREEAIILILILLLFMDKAKSWISFAVSQFQHYTKKDRKKANHNLEEYALKVGKLHEVLETFRETTGASRIGYYVLHNGGKDIRGIPFLKYSCINEAVAVGIRPRLRLDKDMQIATILCWTQNLIAGIPQVDDVSELPQNTIKSVLEEQLVKKYAVMPVYEESLLSGFILMEWKLEKYIPTTEDEIKEFAIQCAKMVEINSIKDINHFLSY